MHKTRKAPTADQWNCRDSALMRNNDRLPHHPVQKKEGGREWARFMQQIVPLWCKSKRLTR